ncbi:MAG: hypothetical protein AB2L20_02895 [Mangrovibacterium sp.]
MKQIKRTAVICFSLFIVFLSVFLTESCSKTDEQEPLRHRMIFNCDGNGPLGCPSVEAINKYVDGYANSQVTTFMICSGSDFFHYRSKYGKVFGSEENYRSLEKEGTDMIGAILRRAKDDRMEAFITYRVNDLHFADTTETVSMPNAVSDFWRSHPEYWVNENVGWHSAGAFDFSHKEVRDYKLGVITEQLEKYGALLDGYDLDFMRFIVYFKSKEGEKNAPLMTEWVKAVRAEVDKQSAKYGKRILLSARVPTSVDDCLKKGLDVKEWIKEGLIDFVGIGIHWMGNPAMPVAKFKQELGPTDIPVYTSIDDGGYSPRESYSHGMYRGMASHILSQGGDGIYLFNYFFGEPVSLEKGDQVCRVIVPDLLHEIGLLKTLRHRNKIYCLDDGNEQYWLRPDTPLPLPVSAEKEATANIYIGDDPKKDKPEEIILFFRTDKPVQCNLWVNGKEIKTQKPEYVSLYDRGNNLENKETVYAYILPSFCLKQGNNEVGFHSSSYNKFIVKRLEVALKYGDVKEHGYF